MPSDIHDAGGRRGWTLGIDFGTSNTAAAHTGAVSESIETVQLSHNRTTMSSSVFVESPQSIEVGDVAFDMAQKNPSGFVMSPKRVVPQGSTFVNGYDIPASAPVAAVLRSVLHRAMTAHDGQPPDQLVLTHPEAWTEREIDVLLSATKNLGLDPSRITTVSEPRAAAQYYTRAKPLEPGSKIGVFDFGGGTLDVAVLQSTPEGTFNVISAHGDNQIGGKNFDAQIRRWVDAQLEEEHPDALGYLRTSASIEQLYSLDDSIRRAKELLSETQTATISVPSGAESIKLQITRGELEAIIAPALQAAYDLTQRTFATAGISSPADLTALYLTGGSSRIPAVHELLSTLGPIATLDDPKTVVAQGALSAAAPILRGLEPGARTAGPGLFGGRIGNQHAGQHYPEKAQPSASPKGTSGAGTGAKKRALPLALAAIASLIVVAIVGTLVVRAVSSNESSGETQETTAAPAAQQADNSPVTETEDIIDALPRRLADEIDAESCQATGETTNGGRELRCDFNSGSTLVPKPDEGPGLENQLVVSVDPDDAEARVIAIRNGSTPNISSGDGTPVDELLENSQRTAAARIQGTEGPDDTLDSIDVEYANNSTGALVHVTEFRTLDQARQFLANSALIN